MCTCDVSVCYRVWKLVLILLYFQCEIQGLNSGPQLALWELYLMSHLVSIRWIFFLFSYLYRCYAYSCLLTIFPKKPEEGMGSLGIGVKGSLWDTMWISGIKPRLSPGAARTLRSLSSSPRWKFVNTVVVCLPHQLRCRVMNDSSYRLLAPLYLIGQKSYLQLP